MDKKAQRYNNCLVFRGISTATQAPRESYRRQRWIRIKREPIEFESPRESLQGCNSIPVKPPIYHRVITNLSCLSTNSPLGHRVNEAYSQGACEMEKSRRLERILEIRELICRSPATGRPKPTSPST
ncbi:MAG: hypothetical protein VX970_11260 [Planctomycetota bacterium]|nr:hypothetical protein [Planctomycetota bacterium]